MPVTSVLKSLRHDHMNWEASLIYTDPAWVMREGRREEEKTGEKGQKAKGRKEKEHYLICSCWCDFRRIL